MKIIGTIDRIEGERAVVLTESGHLTMPTALVAGMSEGDQVTITLEKDEKATQKTRAKVGAAVKEIFREE